MQIAISGANGFLGSTLCKYLIRNNVQVLAITGKSSNLESLQEVVGSPYLRIVSAVNDWEKTIDFAAIDCILHTATNYGRNGATAIEVFEVNEQFSLRLLQKAVEFKVKTFINTDTALPQGINYYTVSKKNFRNWGKLYAESGIIKFINIELQYIYGVGDSKNSFIKSIINSFANGDTSLKLTYGEQRRDFIYIDDVIKAYALILDNIETIQESYVDIELGSGNSVAIKELVLLIESIVGNKGTAIKFGAIEYRKNEPMDMKADIAYLRQLGWKPECSLINGINNCIKA